VIHLRFAMFSRFKIAQTIFKQLQSLVMQLFDTEYSIIQHIV